MLFTAKKYKLPRCFLIFLFNGVLVNFHIMVMNSEICLNKAENRLNVKYPQSATIYLVTCRVFIKANFIYMNESTNSERPRRVIRISRTKFVVMIIIVVILALLVFGGYRMLTTTFGTNSVAPMMDFPVMEYQSRDSMGESKANSVMPYYPDRYPGGQGDITDTRQFMKTSYSANIKTRNVQKVVNDVNNIVKGMDGRVDSMNSSERNGYITFVVAKSDFESFKTQIAMLTSAKLYSENISSQNLLSTKQNIEEQTTNVENSLASLNTQKKNLETSHTQTIAAMNSELYSIRVQLAAVRLNIASSTSTTDAATLASWRSQEQNLLNQELATNQKIGRENASYSAQKQSTENQITYQNANLTSIKQQDTKFTNNIETVSGTISVSWVSVWQLIRIYSPISPIWIIIILIILIWAYLNHKKITPQIIIG